MRSGRPLCLDTKSLARGGPLKAATQLTLVAWDGRYLRLEARNIKTGTRLMLLRQNADTDLARSHRRVDPFLALHLSLMRLFLLLPGLSPFQFLERRGGKKDHQQGDSAKRGNH